MRLSTLVVITSACALALSGCGSKGSAQSAAGSDTLTQTGMMIGTPAYECAPIDVEAMRWRADSELEDLSAIDIGVMPLPDDRWSKGKCGLKALQFMALGIPTVCSPVGVNTDIIQDDENGFIAGTEDEWVEKLSRLLRSAELRQRLGQAGRATVEQKYSAITQSPRVHEIFKSVLNPGYSRMNTDPIRVRSEEAIGKS